MWIWYMSASDGGNLAAIAAQAHAAGVTTLFVKSSDGSTNYWSQFSPQLVAEAARARAEGVRVAVRLRVEPGGRGGTRRAGGGRRRGLPGDRRRVRVRRPVRGGADLYRRPCARKIGPSYPLGWRRSRTSTTTRRFPTRSSSARTARSSTRRRCTGRTSARPSTRVYVNTYDQNRVYGRPIVPLGQTYGGRQPRKSCASASWPPPTGRRLLLLGLAGNDGQRGGRRWRRRSSAHERHVPQPELTSPTAARRARGRPGAVAAGAPRERVPGPADDGHLRSDDARRTSSSSRPRTASPRRARPTRRPGHACWRSRRSR